MRDDIPFNCTEYHRDNSISLVPVYSAEPRPIGKIGCADCISSLDTVDTFTIGRSIANSPAGRHCRPPRPQELRFNCALDRSVRSPVGRARRTRCTCRLAGFVARWRPPSPIGSPQSLLYVPPRSPRSTATPTLATASRPRARRYCDGYFPGRRGTRTSPRCTPETRSSPPACFSAGRVMAIDVGKSVRTRV